jgi:CBS domain-containing protein
MPKTEEDMQSRILELSTEAFPAFCDDISGMFGVEMASVVHPPCKETVRGLQKRFKKLCAVDSVNAEGVLNGTFHVVFDQGGLFTLAGVVVMLPENRINEVIRQGSTEEAQRMGDAIAELGNLMVGTWDRVFREALQKRHRHFKQAGTFIGKPWDSPEKVLGVGADEEFLFIPTTMTVGPYPEFTCGVVFPSSVFATPAETEETPGASADGATTDQETAESESAAADAEEQAPDAAEETVQPMEKTVADSLPEQCVSQPAEPEAAAGGPAPARWPHATLALTAQQIMQKDVVWLTPDDTVQDAVNKMQRHETGYLMIGGGGVLEGIVSRSDVAGAVSPYLRPVFAKWKRPLDDATLQIKLSWVMTRPVRTITPRTPLDVIVDTMLHFGGRCLPVVDQAGAVQGVVTAFDIFKVLTTGRDVSQTGGMPQAALPV